MLGNSMSSKFFLRPTRCRFASLIANGASQRIRTHQIVALLKQTYQIVTKGDPSKKQVIDVKFEHKEETFMPDRSTDTRRVDSIVRWAILWARKRDKREFSRQMEHRSLTWSVACWPRDCRRVQKIFGRGINSVQMPAAAKFLQWSVRAVFPRWKWQFLWENTEKVEESALSYTHPIAIMHVFLAVLDSIYRFTNRAPWQFQ